MTESRRISEKNRILEEIRLTEKYISTNQNTIKQLSKQSTNDTFTLTQLKKLKDKNVEHYLKIETIKIRLIDLNNGDLDNELASQLSDIKDEIDRKSQKKHAIKISQQQTFNNHKLQANTNASRQPYQNSSYSKPKPCNNFQDTSKSQDFRTLPSRIVKPTDTQSQQLPIENDNGFNYFKKIYDSVPEYILKKLKDMPNNKGYVWKGMYCFGKLQAERGKPFMLFERQRDGILVIHEWTDREFKIWHKHDNGQKLLITCKSRNTSK